MVDNNIFGIHYYGGFIPNANRTYYLTRSQPPLFTEEALAVYNFHLRHPNFSYQETLRPFFNRGITHQYSENLPKHYQATFHDWLKYEVLPAATQYFHYWADPHFTSFSEKINPRVVTCNWNGCVHKYIYRYYTDGVGPTPEVARSTQPKNRILYPDVIHYFCQHPKQNPKHIFYRGNCKQPYNIHDLTQHYYASDRAIRMSGFDLSGRFGVKGQYTAYSIPISFNSFLYKMGKDITTIRHTVGLAKKHQYQQFLENLKTQINHVLRRKDGSYSDKIIFQLLPQHAVKQKKYNNRIFMRVITSHYGVMLAPKELPARC